MVVVISFAKKEHTFHSIMKVLMHTIFKKFEKISTNKKRLTI